MCGAGVQAGCTLQIMRCGGSRLITTHDPLHAPSVPAKPPSRSSSGAFAARPRVSRVGAPLTAAKGSAAHPRPRPGAAPPPMPKGSPSCAPSSAAAPPARPPEKGSASAAGASPPCRSSSSPKRPPPLSPPPPSPALCRWPCGSLAKAKASRPSAPPPPRRAPAGAPLCWSPCPPSPRPGTPLPRPALAPAAPWSRSSRSPCAECTGEAHARAATGLPAATRHTRRHHKLPVLCSVAGRAPVPPSECSAGTAGQDSTLHSMDREVTARAGTAPTARTNPCSIQRTGAEAHRLGTQARAGRQRAAASPSCPARWRSPRQALERPAHASACGQAAAASALAPSWHSRAMTRAARASAPAAPGRG